LSPSPSPGSGALSQVSKAIFVCSVPLYSKVRRGTFLDGLHGCNRRASPLFLYTRIIPQKDEDNTSGDTRQSKARRQCNAISMQQTHSGTYATGEVPILGAAHAKVRGLGVATWQQAMSSSQIRSERSAVRLPLTLTDQWNEHSTASLPGRPEGSPGMSRSIEEFPERTWVTSTVLDSD